MQDPTKLEVWQRAHRLAEEINRATASFAPEHRELAEFLRRAAASMVANLGEGVGRLNPDDIA